MEANKTPPTKLVTIKQLATMEQYASAFPENRLRSLIASAAPRLNSRGHTIPANGLFEAGAVMKIGKRILIDIDAFQRWLVSKRLA
jgi:hypothetical protein